MKITEIKTFLVHGGWRTFLLVKVCTDEGISGVGEATLEGHSKTVEAAIKELERYLIGQDPFEIEDHWQKMYRNPFWVSGPVLLSAISSVEHALWDILGKALNVPVYRLLGGKCRDRVRMYANAWFGGCQTPEDFGKAAAKTVEERGYTALKWDPLGPVYQVMDRREIRRTVEIVKAVREAIGPDVDLLIEFHGKLNPTTAIKVARELEAFDPYLIEEPILWENMDAWKKLKDKVNVPLSTGDRIYTKWGFKELIEQQLVDIITADLCHAGGILECKKIAAMAEAYYIPIAPHNIGSSIATAVCLQFAACTTNFLLLERLLPTPASTGVVKSEPFEVENGMMKIPDKPGLGVFLNEEAPAQYPYQPVDVRMYGSAHLPPS